MIRITTTVNRNFARAALLACFSGAVACVSGSGHAATLPCGKMLEAKLPNTRVTAAYEVVGMLPETHVVSLSSKMAAAAPGPASLKADPYLHDLPRFCRVIATLTPVEKSHIVIELWLPEKWNGKLLGIGNHGFAGEFEHNDMAMGLGRGYAVVATDTGHSASTEIDAKWARDNDVALDDFAWRATHEMTVAAKALVELAYGRGARRAYFDGCSNGGRQAMREAQQFPSDYDAIIAGSAALYWTRLFAAHVWDFQTGALPSGGRISLAKIRLAHDAALDACDRLDGAADRLIADPTRCGWKPSALLCEPGKDPARCLTSEEVAVVARMESPIVDPRTGENIYDESPPGSELLWMSPLGNTAKLDVLTASYFRDMVMRDPSLSVADADVFQMLRKSEEPNAPGSRINTLDPDLSAFRDRGGKLIQYHGWNDQAMRPGFNPRFYHEVIDLQPGGDKVAATQRFYRLFMVPGMGHCYAAEGPNTFGGLGQAPLPVVDADHDVLEALDRWSEKGQAPDRIIATQFADGQIPQRQMPLCPFPSTAQYVSGDANRAESFECR